MTARKPVSWFLTEKGRRVSFTIIAGTSIACTLAKFAPHSFLLEKYKDMVHYYNNGQPVQLPKELSDRYNKCLDILNVPDIHRKLIVPFSAYGYDLFHAGSTKSRFGAAVGIPVNFSYKTINDLEKDGVQVNRKPLDYTSEVGQKLADALILPEKVQEFAICREILMTQNSKFMYESVYPFTCIFFAYNVSQMINNKLQLYARPVMMRAIMYTIVGLFSVGSYFLMKDMTEVYYESEVDKKLCEISPEFVESGKIFYEKILLRNQALRELMGNEGKKKYSTLGNENFGLRQPRIALVHRKQYFERKLKELGHKVEDAVDSELM